MITGAVPITRDNFTKLQCRIKEEERSEDNFLTSISYFLQTGRKGLWLVEDQSDYLILCLHPNSEGRILVFLPPRRAPLRLLIEISSELYKKNLEVRVSRVGSFHRELMEGCRYFFRIEEEILDWRFPCLVLDNRILAETHGGKFESFRQKANRISRNLPNIHRISKQYSTDPLKICLDNWAEDVSRKGVFLKKDLLSSNMNAISMAIDEICGVEGYSITVKDEVVGFFVNDYAKEREIVCGITMCSDRRMVGASEYCYSAMAEVSLQKGFSFTNINGAETDTLNDFRKRLRAAWGYSIDTFVYSE